MSQTIPNGTTTKLVSRNTCVDNVSTRRTERRDTCDVPRSFPPSVQGYQKIGNAEFLLPGWAVRVRPPGARCACLPHSTQDISLASSSQNAERNPETLPRDYHGALVVTSPPSLLTSRLTYLLGSSLPYPRGIWGQPWRPRPKQPAMHPRWGCSPRLGSGRARARTAAWPAS